MAQATLLAPTTTASWLDRPILPSWQRILGILAHWEIIGYGLLVGSGFVLRVWDVGSRAMHHDESLHAYYAFQLFTGNGYAYDPLMHGPFKFEMLSLFYLLFGVSEFSARLLPVLFGTAMIALPYFLRHHLTRSGALLVAGMVTISPTLMYFSRFIRDDIILATFTFALFICIVRYLETRQPRYVYIGAACMAFAMSTMEAAYITFFIFGSFLIFEVVREFLSNTQGPVIKAFKETSLDTWLTGVSIFVVLVVLMYSTFFTNPTGIWDNRFGLTSPDRKDILGGLTYWQQQHGVERGGQPWFYYFMVIPLYEQLAVVFGLAGIVYAFVRRSLVRTFLVWWAVMSFAIYSWAGEKMPWLSEHMTLPLIVLAGLFLGSVFQSRHFWRRWVVVGAFGVLAALEIHSTFALSYQNGANPTEMLIYVQTSQDVPNVVQELNQLQTRVKRPLQIGIDNTDVGGWPYDWYLRDQSGVKYTSTFSGPSCGAPPHATYCDALIMLEPQYNTFASSLGKRYVVQRYRWNWWFPEDYKQWIPDHVGSLFSALGGHGSVVADPIGQPQDWVHLWNWLIYRQPFAERGARWMYVFVRRDLVPNAKDFSSAPPPGSSPPPSTLNAPVLPVSVLTTAGGTNVLSGPRGIAASANGDVYVADTLDHQIVEISPGGSVIRKWGSAGTGPGQFAATGGQDSPLGIAVGPTGDVFVADTWNQRIEVFSKDGRFLRQWGGTPIGAAPGQFYGPRSIAVSRDGRVYVADTGNKRIQIFSSSGTYIGSFGNLGTGSGQFNEPSSVAVDSAGTVYVADFWNQRIQAFTRDGSFVRSWAVPDWQGQSYDEPYLGVDSKTGVVYASDPSQQRVLAFTTAGRLLGAFGASHLSLPIGIAISSGRVAVGDTRAGTVTTFRVTLPATGKRAKR
jgi:uncharacterized protein (TIGR03663 family)